jgi:hypothetical protein
MTLIMSKAWFDSKSPHFCSVKAGADLNFVYPGLIGSSVANGD